MSVVGVILAAGSGGRLRPFTDRSPKCLIDVGGRSILAGLLHALASAGVTRVVVVTGYRAEQIDAHVYGHPHGIDISTVRNPAYATTNNAASLLAARAAIGGLPFVLCDGDVVFTENPFPALLASPDASVVAVDAGAPFSEEAMKVRLDADGRVTTLSKGLSAAQSAGESLGLQRIGGDFLPDVWDALEAAVARDAARSYYEDAFQQLLDRGVRMGIARVATGTCMEIDDAADLEAARRLLEGGTA